MNVVAGFIQLAGGHPAYPRFDDQRAIDDDIDLYVIIRGAQYNVHVALARGEGDNLKFVIPSTYENLMVIGLIPTSPLCCDAIELPSELIAEHGKRRNVHLEIEIKRKGDNYVTGATAWPKIERFDQRL